MNSIRPTALAVALAAALCVFVGPTGPVGAEAEEIHLPIVGRQFLTLGAEVRGGPVLDYRTDQLGASTTLGPRGRIGLQHILSSRLSMNIEGAAGATWLAAHPMAPDGQADAEVAFDFNISILARYMAIGPTRGWTFAGGIHYRRAGLRAGSLLQMGLDARLGYNVWTDDERFFIVELGVHAPVFEGLSMPQRGVDQTDDDPDDRWYQPSASLGVQWSF